MTEKLDTWNSEKGIYCICFHIWTGHWVAFKVSISNKTISQILSHGLSRAIMYHILFCFTDIKWSLRLSELLSCGYILVLKVTGFFFKITITHFSSTKIKVFVIVIFTQDWFFSSLVKNLKISRGNYFVSFCLHGYKISFRINLSFRKQILWKLDPVSWLMIRNISKSSTCYIILYSTLYYVIFQLFFCFMDMI